MHKELSLLNLASCLISVRGHRCMYDGGTAMHMVGYKVKVDIIKKLLAHGSRYQ